MYTLNRYVPKVLFPTGIAPAGKRARDLKPGEMGLFDEDTKLSVDVATYCVDKTYVIKWKTTSGGMNNAMFPDITGAKLPIESLPIRQIDHANCFDAADAKGKPFVAYLGWDGISDCKTLSFECGKDYGLLIKVRGETVRDVFGKNLEEIVPFNTGCCDDCELDEDCSVTVPNILEAIEKSSFYVDNYFSAEIVKSCCPEEDPFDKKIYKKWRIAVCDTGDSTALATLCSQYPDYDIECIGRDGATSTYEICIPDGETPEDFTLERAAALECDECPDCPESFTKVPAGDKYIACFDAAADAGVTTLEEFDTDYYADQTTAQDTVNALVEAAGALVPGYIAESADVIGVTCDKVTLKVCVEAETEVTEHGVAGLTLTHIGECKGYCEGSEDFSWSECGEAYKITRKLCLTHKKEDCERPDSYYLDKITKQLEVEKDVQIDNLVIKASNDCMITYEVEQCNNSCLMDGCDTFGKDGAKFDRLPSFEGHVWAMCDCDGWTVDDETGCPLPPENELPGDCLCGIKFTGALVDRECIPCSMGIDDDIPREPVTIEVSIIDQYNEEECDTLQVDWTVAQYGKMPEGLGQYAAKSEVLSRKYDNYIYTNPKGELGNLMAHRLGYDFSANSCGVYNSVYLRHCFGRKNNYYQGHQGGIREEIEIKVDAGNPKLLEKVKDFLNKTILSHGNCKTL